MKIKTEPVEVWQEYQDGLGFNSVIGLEETVKINNDFYNGRQWEGVNAPDLDKPVFNIIKPPVNYYVAQLVSDDVSANIEVEAGAGAGYAPPTGNILSPEEYLGKVMGQAVAETLEQTEAADKHRLLLKCEALDGDMALHSYFDTTVDTGQTAIGLIRTEIIHNTDIFFGDTSSSEVERQPYIIIRQRLPLLTVMEEARANGIDPTAIHADNEVMYEAEDTSKQYTTVLTKYYKAKTEGAAGKKTVHYLRCTETCLLKKPTDLGYTLYPVAYSCWEKQKGSYHGISPVTAQINNQIMLNKMYALASLDRQNYSFPKVLYDGSRLTEGWNPNPGAAIETNGSPKDVLADFRPADMSAQVLQLIGDIEERTKSSMGVYDAALGNAKPDNTSAILAVQQAAATPLDLQRQDFHRFVECCVRIWLDMMSVDYGVRRVAVELMQADGSTASVPVDFDYADIGRFRWRLHIDIGAAARWSEILHVQMLDNLLRANIIDSEGYLEALPEGYLPGKGKLLQRLRDARQAQMQAQMQPQQQASLPEKNLQLDTLM